MPDTARPTQKQLSYLRALALERGETFAMPRSKTEASHEIRRLRRRPRSSRAEVAADRGAVVEQLGAGGDAARVRDEEITGYGSTASWSAA